MPLPPPVQRELIAALARFRKEAARGDAAAVKQLADAYAKIHQRLKSELELELRRIFDQPEGVVTRAYINRRLSALAEQVEDELSKYQTILSSTIDVSTDGALLQGSKHALELMRLATLGRRALINIDFDRLNPEQVNTMIGFLAPSSPLYKRIGQLARFHSPIVRDQLVEAIALGYNPYKAAGNITPFLRDIAAKFQTAMARPFADAVRMARTAQLWAYREAARANYVANNDIVTGWVWTCQTDSLVCPACLSLHGSVHPLDEPLEGHYHCRCSATPQVLGQSIIPESAGLDYFNGLPEEQQRAILGPGAFDAWKAGKIDFSQFHHRAPDETYGGMQVVPPLKDLLQE